MKNNLVHLSVVSPVYQAEDLLDELVERLLKQMLLITDQFEIILVEDGSRDNSWKKIEDLCLIDKRIKGIRFSRNFGQHAAIAAGLKAALGAWVVVMDCDLQDRPEEIPLLYSKAREGFDVVLARRERRQHNVYARMFSKVFYKILSFLSGITYDNTIANFGIYSHKAILSMLQVHSSFKYFPLMVKWVGFYQTSLSVNHAERPRGESSYNFRIKFRLATNIVLAYSDKLLKMIVSFGMTVALGSFIFAMFMIYRALKGQILVIGYSSLIVSIFFFSGVIIFLLGILGLYIGKVFDSSRIKPDYLVREQINLSGK